MASGGSEVDFDVRVHANERGDASNFRALSEILAARLPRPVIGVDRAGCIVLMNPAAKSRLGEGETCEGERLPELLGLGADETLDFEQAICGRGQMLTVPVSGDPLDPLTLTILPCRREQDGGGALILLDAEPEESAEGEAMQRLAALGRLSAGVAHEIRNPLSGIGTNAQVLRRRLEAGDPRSRFIDFILEEVHRLDKIIEDMLRFARPPEPRMVPHDLSDTVAKVLMQASGKIEAKHLEVTTEIADERPRVFVDPDHMAQIVLNIVLNAVQAMSDGGKLTIRLSEAQGSVSSAGPRPAAPSGPPRFASLAVIDDGVGIDPNDMPKLFEPFFTTRPSGTGLGLSTSQVLIRQHGGGLNIDSMPGHGTTVTVLVPLEKRRAATT